MKFSSGKRIGQSKDELLTAASFSLFLHLLFAFAAVLLYTATPRFSVPPVYSVQLVGPAAERTVPAPVKPQPQPEPKPAVKPEARVQEKKTPPKPPAADNKNAVPELNAPKPKPAKTLETAETSRTEPEPTAPAQPAAPAEKGESVAVTSQQDFKYGWYLAAVRSKIMMNWRPMEGSRGSRARVIFVLNRSGRLMAVNLDPDHTTGSFDFKQAAMRAIQISNPFPQLPDDYPKQAVELSVDLTSRD